jgi:ATP-dependent DNA helicase RecG
MKPSLLKLQKVFRLEADRGYDNHAVVGGIERMLDLWESEARMEGVPDDLIQYIAYRFHDYAHLSENSRAEALQGLWKRIQRRESGEAGEEIEPETEISSNDQVSEVQSIPEAPPISSTEGTAEDLEKTQPQPDAKPPVKSQQVKSGVEPAALNAPVTVLQGIGPRIAQNLNRLGLRTLRDMLYHFPRRYDDYSKLKPINRLEYGEEVTVIGTVESVYVREIHNGKSKLVEALINDGSGSLRVVWFNQIHIAKRLHEGLQIVLAGKVDQYLGRRVMTNPEMEQLEEQQINTNRIVPVYPLTSQVTQHWLRKQMNQVVTNWAPRIQDPLPEDVRRAAELVELPEALLQAHFPDSWEGLQSARERISFDEIFLLQLGVLSQKRAWKEKTAVVIDSDPTWLDGQIRRLPYSLTEAQLRAIHDITGDLASGHPMNRLIQGDVGSGKTVIAGLAIASVTKDNAQACMMAPTSLLAEQHYRSLVKLLAEPAESISSDDSTMPDELPPLQSSEIRLLVGATPEAEKDEIRTGLEQGSIKLVIGTHALIEEPILFNNLQLAVVDEQHRFGVEQRAALRAKGSNPHLLVMTATPIPRSLALTIYGDLDLTVIDEMPPGRQPVSTHVLMPRERERAYSLIRDQLEQGRQAFIIYPMIEENESLETLAAVKEEQRLKDEVFPHFRVGLLHGKLKTEEKDAAMATFRAGEIDILVSTTVIEVGVDIPNATVMLIEGANRFGLAQLHQLRGRVGRGAEKSYCLLIPSNADEVENERLQVMVSTTDGFKLAEKDLEQRGPGQFLGTRQAGFTELQLANLMDIRLVEKARRHAIALFESDPELNFPDHRLLASSLQQFWDGNKSDIS